MRASRRVTSDLLVAAARPCAASSSSRAGCAHAVCLVSAHRCASWTRLYSGTAPNRGTLIAKSRRGFAGDAFESVPTKCWSCAAEFGPSSDHRFFCDACGEILPVVIDVPAGDRDTHVPVPKLFKVLGIAHSFSVDEKTLESAMKERQKTLHPDKFGTASVVAQGHSAEQASLVNRAYVVLRDPLRRARYMLLFAGEKIDARDDDDFGDDFNEMRVKENHSDSTDNDSGGLGGHPGAPGGGIGTAAEHTAVDPHVLVHAMETREAIEDALAVTVSDPEKRAAALSALARGVAAREARCLASIAQAFRSDPVDISTAKRATVELSYLARARDEIREKGE